MRGRRDAFGRDENPHLVTTSCTECGDSVSVPEGNAAAADRGTAAVTCDDCEHDCLDHLTEAADDPSLPDHIVPYVCETCGEFWEFDTQTGEHRRDN